MTLLHEQTKIKEILREDFSEASIVCTSREVVTLSTMLHHVHAIGEHVHDQGAR